MSILIKGMEMPKDCESCTICDWIGCHRWEDNDIGQRDDFCPLVEVPTPHGRWIDKEDPYGFFDLVPVCSECGCIPKYREKTICCPNCGARMSFDEVEE